MTTINSQDGVLKALGDRVEQAFELITKEVYDIFIKEYVLKYAYYNEGENILYHDGNEEPTWEFLKAWEWSDLKRSGVRIIQELWYNWSDMNFNSRSFLHGSVYSNPNDVRETLPEILEGKQSRLWLSVPRKEKFWYKFITDMFESGKLKKIMDKHLSAVGFTIS